MFADIMKADIIFLATPVYFARMTGAMACLIDRLRCFYLGKVYSGRLTNKVGGALAVSWYRNRGIEPALGSLVSTFMALSMLPVSPPRIGSPFGAAGVSSYHGTGDIERAEKVGVLKDKHGLEGARTMAKRAVEVARLLKGA
jgi:multimeric flavodoxin WrbA